MKPLETVCTSTIYASATPYFTYPKPGQRIFVRLGDETVNDFNDPWARLRCLPEGTKIVLPKYHLNKVDWFKIDDSIRDYFAHINNKDYVYGVVKYSSREDVYPTFLYSSAVAGGFSIYINPLQ